MKIKRLLFVLMVIGAVIVPAGAASADILVGYPPNPYAPPPGETTYLVQQIAPADASVLFLPNPGPPNVTIHPPDPGVR